MNLITFSFLIILFSFDFSQVRVESNNVNPSSSSSNSSSNQQYFQIQLDSKNESRLFWAIDYEAEVVTLEVRISKGSKHQWFAIGFSDYGEITNADLCFMWIDRHDKAHFQDAWTDDLSLVFVDQNSNDCKPLLLKKEGRILRFVLQRKFDTCDPKDYVIEEGTTHVVFATGKGPLTRIDGLRLNEFTYGFQRVQLLKNLEPLQKLPKETRMVEILNDHVPVPNIETTYWCRTHLLPEELSEKHHIIQYEASVVPENTPLVHHMEVFHCEISADVELPYYNGPCFDSAKPKMLEYCKRVISAWAMGAGPFTYPKEAGFPFGGANFSRYVMLEIHYNNPELRDDWIDSSGVKIYYTPKLRKYDAGVIEIGLEYTDKNSIPPHQQAFDLAGFCTSECTRASLPPDGITIFASQLHTHLTGIRVWTRHIRGGMELQELNRDNHYSQHFQEIRKLKRQINLLPGDSLINICRYKTTNRENMTLGGYAISEEMCVNYMHYFPKTNLEVCKSSIDTQTLRAYFDYMNSHEGQATDSRNKTVAENYHSIHWNLNRALFLNKLYQTSPLSMQCNQSSGDRFPGYWNGIPVTPIYYPLPHKNKTCNEL